MTCHIAQHLLFSMINAHSYAHAAQWSGSSQLPGGRHEGVAVKMRVSTLGSPRRPVASAPAPGAVPAWARFSGHGPSKMFIFARFYKGSRPDLGQGENVDFPMGFHGFRGCLSEPV